MGLSVDAAGTFQWGDVAHWSALGAGKEWPFMEVMPWILTREPCAVTHEKLHPANSGMRKTVVPKQDGLLGSSQICIFWLKQRSTDLFAIRWGVIKCGGPEAGIRVSRRDRWKKRQVTTRTILSCELGAIIKSDDYIVRSLM